MNDYGIVEIETGDWNLEKISILSAEGVAPFHIANWILDNGRACVLEGLTNLNKGLLTEDAWTDYLSEVGSTGADKPVAFEQLNSDVSYVLNRNGVGEGIHVVFRLRTIL